MSRGSFIAAISATVTACSLVTSLDDLRGHDADTGFVDGASDVAAGDGGAPDGTITCDGGVTFVACDGTCVDTSASGSSCGACGHSCGGGMCTTGVCQPMVVVDKLTDPVFDVDGTNVYFSKGNSTAAELDSCALATQCKLAPTTLAAPGLVYPSTGGSGQVLLAGKNVTFFGELASNVGRQRLFACDPKSGCGTSPITVMNAGLNTFGFELASSGNDVYFTYNKYLVHATCTAPNACGATENMVTSTTSWPRIGLSADMNGIYYVDPTTNALMSCPKSGVCTPSLLLAGLSSAVKNTVAYGGNIYVLDSATTGYSKGSVVICPNTGSCTPAPFVSMQPYPTLIAVDAQGVYWFDSDAMDIKTCPLSGCKPSTRTLASNQVATVLRTDASFVYWATATQILRVAK